MLYNRQMTVQYPLPADYNAGYLPYCFRNNKRSDRACPLSLYAATLISILNDLSFVRSCIYFYSQVLVYQILLFFNQFATVCSDTCINDIGFDHAKQQRVPTLLKHSVLLQLD